MKSGTCPKCGSDDVRIDAPFRSPRNLLMLGIWRTARLVNYACPDCGYLETYLGDLPEKGDLIRKKWRRVKV